MERVYVALVQEPLDPTSIAQRVQEPTKGGVALFLGDVRGQTDAVVTDWLEYEAYPEMALKSMQELAEQAATKYDANVAIVHRLGKLMPGETTVICAAACAHRAEAFECCRQLIDRLKEDVAIWKKEVGPGGESWVGSEHA